jgi:homoserine kinase
VSPYPGVRIFEPGHRDLPHDPARHASGIAAAAVLRRAGVADRGVDLRVTKGLPLAGGQGGSAASAVAGAAAVNALLGTPLGPMALIEAALEAESALAGRHADNVAPILLGGIVLVRSLDPLDIVRLPVPAALRVVLAHPAQRLTTAAARAVLPRTVDRATAIAQAAQVGAIVAALAAGDLALLGRAIEDHIAEPARAPLLHGFTDAKRAALAAGAYGCSISGAGPSSFAFADEGNAPAIADAMRQAYLGAGIEASTRIASIDEHGTRIEVDDRSTAAAAPRA